MRATMRNAVRICAAVFISGIIAKNADAVMLGARTIALGEAAAALPYDYELQYIETSGSQWIDTGVAKSADLKCEIDFKAKSYTAQVFFGSYYENGKLFNFFIRTANLCYLQLASQTKSASFGASNTRYHLEIGNYYVKNLDTETYIINETPVATIVPDKTLKWFYYDRGSSVASSGVIYMYKIWKGSALIKDVIPVMSKEGNAELYDRVSGAFETRYGNLIAGPRKE